VRKQRSINHDLLEALGKAYTARAKLFHNGISASQIDLLIAEIDAIDADDLDWSVASLNISQTALQRVDDTGGQPHQVFAHPEILRKHPHLVAYYRNMATISKKGIGQLVLNTARYEDRTSSTMDPDNAARLCRAVNTIISGVIDSMPEYEIALSRKAIYAEIGTELQGTWNNFIGQGASKAVERVIADHIDANDLGAPNGKRTYKLNNGWSIVFAPEPDVAFFDSEGVKQIAIEIKGSLDVAGAQTRYGEAKKSFQKQISENPRCHTVYLASCFTDAVLEQIQADGQVREWFNLTSILYDDEERAHFLQRLFHIVNTPSK